MTEDRGKNSFAVQTVEGVGVGVANSGRLDLDEHFAGLRAFQIYFNDFKRLFCFECNSGTRFHVCFLRKPVA